MLLTPYGEIRFWDSIGLGLTGGEATHDSLLDLSSDESVTDLIYAEVRDDSTLESDVSKFQLFSLKHL